MLSGRQMPLHWPLFKKVFVTFEICLLTFSVYVSSAIYSAGIETVVKDFGVSRTKATLGLTLFVAGYALGPMIWAPMREIPQIGRNPIYIGTLAVFVILQVPTALPVLSLPDRFYRQPGPGNWGSKHRGYVCSEEESVWYRPLGRLD